LVGWLLGAAVGPGTVLVIFLLGPAVDLLSRRFPIFDVHANTTGAQVPRGDGSG
jgi:uncharacterized membrane protein YczE